ncbi:MAG: hypothetical protein ACXV3A_12165 [Kineosporiaceae bacterium]
MLEKSGSVLEKSGSVLEKSGSVLGMSGSVLGMSGSVLGMSGVGAPVVRRSVLRMSGDARRTRISGGQSAGLPAHRRTTRARAVAPARDDRSSLVLTTQGAG